MHFKMSSAIFFNLDQSKKFSPGNGLKGFFPRVVKSVVKSHRIILVICPLSNSLVFSTLPVDEVLCLFNLTVFENRKQNVATLIDFALALGYQKARIV